MISYTIRHSHHKQKTQAIETVKAVIAALEVDASIPAEGDLPTIKCLYGCSEVAIVHSVYSVSAVIHTYDRPALDLDLPFLNVSESPDRYDSNDWF